MISCCMSVSLCATSKEMTNDKGQGPDASKRFIYVVVHAPATIVATGLGTRMSCSAFTILAGRVYLLRSRRAVNPSENCLPQRCP